MIVDVHTHCIQPDDFGDDTIRAMEGAGLSLEPVSFEDYAAQMQVVDKSILFGVRAVASGWASPNDRTAEWVRRDPERIIGFAAIDPMENGHLEELERAVDDLGLRGVKLYPVLGRYNPADPVVFPLYTAAQRMGLPILFHMGAHPLPNALLKHSLPLLVDEIAQAFPDLVIVIAHMAHPWQRECAVVLRKHPNVFADISGGGWVRPYQAWQALVLMCEWGVTEKLLFGSDFPLWTPREGMEGLRGLNEQVEGTNFPRVPDEVVEGIIHRESLMLLGLA